MRLMSAGGGSDDVAALRVELYGVALRNSGEVIEVFTARAEADELVATWDTDEPDEVIVTPQGQDRVDRDPVGPQRRLVTGSRHRSGGFRRPIH
jgi:hypothetical protein